MDGLPAVGTLDAVFVAGLIQRILFADAGPQYIFPLGASTAPAHPDEVNVQPPAAVVYTVCVSATGSIAMKVAFAFGTV
jgi:hypothetical protein